MPDRVALFATCLVDNLAPGVGVASVRLLEAAGCTVEFPAAQSCCGQPALNSGEPEAAALLARHFLDVFECYDAIVSPSGSCAAMVGHWYPRLVDDDRERVDRVVARTHELSAYLVEVRGHVDLGATLDTKVTMHDACHGLRLLGLKSAPRRLLEAAGATLVEMAEPELCCGFGGTFSEKHPEISGPIADDKLAGAAASGADWLVAGDSGCLMHLEGRRRRSGVGPPGIHYAELLAQGLEA